MMELNLWTAVSAAGVLLCRIGAMSDVPRPRDFEKSDVDPRLIGILALGTAFFLVAAPFALDAFYPPARMATVRPGGLPKPQAPRLQVDPGIDLDALRDHERERLQSFAWVNRDRQVVRIPIDLAMRILAKGGIPGWSLSQPSDVMSR
jgi:hypothetical protein